jgi:2,4-dienoyl-CoA reductase-like NADH-dependent reductase (Old Yellow Enzyme family)
MKGIFDSSSIKVMKLRNRLVRSATWEGMCDQDGKPTEKLIKCYRDLAGGGVGLIITGYTFVSPEGKQLPGKMGIHTDAFAPEMKSMVQAVHDEGGSICVQLVHAGGQTTEDMIGRKPLAPSDVEAEQYQGQKPDEMTVEDINNTIEAFGAAAGRAKDYGFDAVQLHSSHGYLINQFLSPLTNRRTDEYGGSAENRRRFLLEVYARVRKAVGEGFPVLVKLNGSDNLEGGLEPEEALDAARAIDEAGIDAIEVSGGTPASGELSPVRTKILKPELEAYNLSLAVKIKEAVSCPVIAVGGFRSYEVATKALSEVDYISLARPLIREPGLPARWESGDTSKAKCISCNKCFLAGIKEGGIYCVAEKKDKA